MRGALNRPGLSSGQAQTCAGLLLLMSLLLPSIRHLTESSMQAHMLVQYPCLLLSGALLARALPARCTSVLQRWNDLGIPGLVCTALVWAVLMIPRVLDLALANTAVEASKVIALVIGGAALRLSWRHAGPVVQAFFLGNTLPMTAAVGMLYQDMAVRVCNAYRLDDQQNLGGMLVAATIALGAVWCMHAALSRADSSRVRGL